MVTTKISQSYLRVSNYSSLKFYIRIRFTDWNIRDCLLLICAFIISDVTQPIVLQFLQNLKQQHFRFFCRFSRKVVQILIFRVKYLENGLADFNDVGLIWKDFGGLWDEINLFWRCSSPLIVSFTTPGSYSHFSCYLSLYPWSILCSHSFARFPSRFSWLVKFVFSSAFEFTVLYILLCT